MDRFRNRRCAFALALLAIASAALACVGCSSFSVYDGTVALLGDSEDAGPWHPLAEDPDAACIFVLAPTATDYGQAHLGWLWQGRHRSFQAGINDRGLGYSLTAVPDVAMNAHPERPYRHGEDSLYRLLLGRAATVEEGIDVVSQFDFASMWFQILLADAGGDAAIVGPGPDGELAVTRKASDKRAWVAATFNVADPRQFISRDSFTRVDDATAILVHETADASHTLAAAERALEVVHRERPYALGGTYTMYSTLYDLTNREIHHVHLGRFDAPVLVDLTAEWALGDHVLRIAELVPEDVRDAAADRYRLKQRLGIGVAAAAVLGVVAVAVKLVIELL